MAAIVGSGIALIDGTVVNVALPAIQSDLGGGLSSQQWIVNAYMLTLGSFLLVGGSLGDVYGERRIFAIGVAGFGVTSVLCALAPTIELLILARALQGVAGALLVPSALAAIVSTFPEDERGGAIGSWTAWSGIATIIGPVLGGWLVDVSSWRLIFAINVPFVLLALYLIATAIPQRERGQSGRHVDVIGAALCALGLAGPTYGLIAQPDAGWTSPRVLVPILGGIVMLGLFVVWERRAPDPMLRLELFKRRNFAVGEPRDAPHVRGPLGDAVLPRPVPAERGRLHGVPGRAVARAGDAPDVRALAALRRPRRPLRTALLHGRRTPRLRPGDAAHAAPRARRGLRDGPAPGHPRVRLGLSITVAPLTAAVLAGVDDSHAGIASGINNAIARVAGLLGTAAVGVLVAAQFGSALEDALRRQPAPIRPSRRWPSSATGRSAGSPSTTCRPPSASQCRPWRAEASTNAFHAGLGVAALLAATGGLIALAGIENPRRVVRASGCTGGALAPATAEGSRHHARAEA